MSSAPDLLTGEFFFVFGDSLTELYYFAYGSNMNSFQMQKRCAKPKVVTIARLADYRIAFFGHSKIWDGAQETLVRHPGHEVWGVVYEISTVDQERLDAWQDVRMDGTGPYFHYPARVKGADGQMYTVLFYKKDILGEPRRPSKPYLDFIITGAKEKQLPPGYIQDLKAVESNPATYPVPKPRTFNPESLLAWDCSDCSA